MQLGPNSDLVTLVKSNVIRIVFSRRLTHGLPSSTCDPILAFPVLSDMRLVISRVKSYHVRYWIYSYYNVLEETSRVFFMSE